jgi:flagellin-like hook-associated protein FlgL
MTVIKNSMFPFRSSFQHISNMKDRFDVLQGQLATGQKAATLAEMGSSRFFDLSMRARLSKISGYQDTITSVNLRLDVMDTTISRLDQLEADQRTLATPGGYGSSNINLSITPDLSLARLDEVLDLLKASVDGRYLFGGSTTDKEPVEDTASILDGELGRDGFRTVVGERKLADAGTDGLGRLDITTVTDTVTLAEDGSHPFGFKLSTLSTSGTNIALTQPTGTPPSLSMQITALPVAGEKVTIGLTLPDGSQEVITLTATTGATEAGAFQIGADPDATAANLATALQASLEKLGGTALAAASTFAAADNFFNGQGDPVLRVDGPPFDTATALVAATPADTVFWYRGETQGIRADDLGRLNVSTAAGTTTLAEAAPVAPGYGFRIDSVTEGLTNATATLAGTNPESLAVAFTGLPSAGESINIRLTLPDGSAKDITLRAVTGAAGPGEFTIGADANATSANFGAALNTSLGIAAKQAAGDPRATVTAKIEDNTNVKYGVQANENGFVSLIRSLAAMTVETYPEGDPTTNGRFDGMAVRQQSRLSEAHNNEAGSIEVVSIELNLAKTRMANISERLVSSDAQLKTMLEEIEGVSKEEVAMEILALQTRLEASYQTTALVAQLSLVNYM